MDRCRNLELNLYMGYIYGGLLYFVTDFSVMMATGTNGYTPTILYPRYFLASILSTFFYTYSVPFLKWSMARDQYYVGVWKLSAVNNLFFSAVLPLATFTCTEGFGFLLIGPDPIVEKRFHTLIAHGFCMTMLMERLKIFDTYRNHYLQDLAE
jgi:hypothetical protein